MENPVKSCIIFVDHVNEKIKRTQIDMNTNPMNLANKKEKEKIQIEFISLPNSRISNQRKRESNKDVVFLWAVSSLHDRLQG